MPTSLRTGRPMLTFAPEGRTCRVEACGPLLLIADGYFDAAVSLAEVFKLYGYPRVHVVYDGPSALEAARRLRPQVVLAELLQRPGIHAPARPAPVRTSPGAGRRTPESCAAALASRARPPRRTPPARGCCAGAARRRPGVSP